MLPLYQLQEIVAIATDEHTAVSRGVVKHLFILGGRIENLWQANNLVSKFGQRRERRGPEETSCLWGHLARDQEIDLTPVVFVVSQAFVDLSLCNVGKAVGNDRVHTLSVLQEANDIVNTDTGSFDHGMAAADLR